MARDIYHEHVRTALEKNGWTVTHDPLRVEQRKRQAIQIDLGAERLPGTEQDNQKIAVEIKSCVSISELEDLYNDMASLWFTAMRSGASNLSVNCIWLFAPLFTKACLPAPKMKHFVWLRTSNCSLSMLRQRRL